MSSPERSNAKVEQAWIDAWSELLELVGDRHNVVCLLPNYRPVTVEECKDWLQDSAYDGFSLALCETYFEGRKAIAASRTKM